MIATSSRVFFLKFAHKAARLYFICEGLSFKQEIGVPNPRVLEIQKVRHNLLGEYFIWRHI